MHRSFKYLLSPTKAQRGRLEQLLAVQAEVYNAALEERRGAWRLEHRRVTKYEQYGQVAELRRCRPDVAAFGVTVTRGTLTRVDEASSQRCAACGHTARDNRRTQAVFRCQRCGRADHADVNAAVNILRAGLAQREQREAPGRCASRATYPEASP